MGRRREGGRLRLFVIALWSIAVLGGMTGRAAAGVDVERLTIGGEIRARAVGLGTDVDQRSPDGQARSHDPCPPRRRRPDAL